MVWTSGPYIVHEMALGFLLEITEHKENEEYVVMSCRLEMWPSAKLRVIILAPSLGDC